MQLTNSDAGFKVYFQQTFVGKIENINQKQLRQDLFTIFFLVLSPTKYMMKIKLQKKERKTKNTNNVKKKSLKWLKICLTFFLTWAVGLLEQLIKLASAGDASSILFFF